MQDYIDQHRRGGNIHLPAEEGLKDYIDHHKRGGNIIITSRREVPRYH